nr:HK97-gp10 family putative phage morphogenesis protein [Haloechinothrix aidingensis]
MHVSIDGVDRLKGKLDELPPAVRTALESAIASETQAVADDMRDTAPRGETGELIDSIESRVDGLTGTVAATATHAIWVEFGTSKMAAQPFAAPAVEGSRTRLPRRVRVQLESALKDISR